MQQTLFIADLHISPARADITQRFVDFIDNTAMHAKSLYILGDLFEFWIGDDHLDSSAKIVINKLRQLTDSGVTCYFIHGNRDFLIGKKFARDTGVTILPEKHILNINNQKIIILHGDILCTDDINYQKLRKIISNPIIQTIFLLLPLKIRLKIAAKMRHKSALANTCKKVEIMDVNNNEVISLMQKTKTTLMIHGHTHKPATHIVKSQPLQKRVVLGTWEDEISYLAI